MKLNRDYLEAPFPNAQIDAKGGIYFCNRAMCDLLGLETPSARIEDVFVDPVKFIEFKTLLESDQASSNYQARIAILGGKTVNAKLTLTLDAHSHNKRLWIDTSESVRDANDSLKLFFNAVPQPLLVCCEQTGKILKYNQSARDLFGAISTIQAVLPNDMFQFIMVQMKQGDNVVSQTFPLELDRDFAPKTQIEARRLPLKKGNVILIGFKEIFEQDSNQIDFFEHAPIPMLLAENDEKGYILRTNRRAREVFVDEAFETGKKIRLKNILGLRNYLQIVQKLNTSGFIDEFEIEISTTYGEKISCLLNGYFIPTDKGKAIQLSISDITERKEAQETLSRFFSAAPLPMILTRLRDNQVVQINHRAAELFVAHDNVKFHGMTIHALLGEEATDVFLQNLKAGGFIDDFEIKIETPYGETIWGLLSGQYLRANNEECVLIGINDISERKQMEAAIISSRENALKATKQKSMFLSTMSHEIRTPMTGVLGMLELLHLTKLDNEQQEAVTVVKDSATSLLTIIDDILDFSKIEAGRLSIEAIDFDLQEVVEGATDLMGGRARTKGLELICHIQKDVPTHLVGDPTRIRQILLNLVGNAIKFTSEGTVTVQVSLVKAKKKRAKLHFAIIDQGIGISKDKQELLFTPFQQTDSFTTRQFGGTGLGLSICKALTELMNGKVGIESEEGEGSIFWFDIEFPTVEADDQTKAAPLEDLSILVQQNNQTVLTTIQETLESAKANVTAMLNLDEVVKTTNKNDFDLIIVDHSPKEPKSTQTVRTLLENGVQKNQIILTRIDNSEEVKSELEDLGIAATPFKPLKSSSLLSLVKNIVRPDENSAKPTEFVSKKAMSRARAIEEGKLILFADDNATNRLVIGKQLNKLGYAFDVAKDGVEALEMFLNTPYNLVLSDVRMPEMNGHELSLKIREFELKRNVSRDNRIPILALTANAAPEDGEACYSAGMDDYLVKPLTFEKLGAAMAKWLPINLDIEMPSSANTSPDVASTAIDLNGLSEILGTDDTDMLKEILFFFEETFCELFDDMRQHVVDYDPEKLSEVAHAAKGASRNASARQLGSLLETLEKTAVQITQADAQILLLQIENELSNVKHFIGDLRNG